LVIETSLHYDARSEKHKIKLHPQIYYERLKWWVSCYYSAQNFVFPLPT